ncbi:MAG: outer membrane beta-barrel protein [Bacteroidota bacterium]|nr:outer membrane beta-barrel protein [Bacteroidota bacterium]
MKRVKFLLVVLSVIAATTTFAQQSPSRRGLSISVGPEFAAPLGTFRNGYTVTGGSTSGYKLGFGGSVKLNLPVATNVDVSVSAGYMGFSQKASIGQLSNVSINKGSYTFIPFKAGLRFRANGGFYVEPQAGYTQTKLQNSEGAGEFTYAGNIGYMIGRAIDVAVRYEAIATKPESSKFIGLRLAYNIPFARVRS